MLQKVFMEEMEKGFNIVISQDSEILILGSMPGTKSLDAAEYYAHPRNAFWGIIEHVFNIERSLDYTKRTEMLLMKKVALWDVIHACERKGSLDSNINNNSVVYNDLISVFENYKRIKKVLLNGKTAANKFQKYCKENSFEKKFDVFVLPSTSPAHAALRFEDKLKAWKKALL